MPQPEHLDPGAYAADGGPIGVLLIHGYTGSVAETRPMGEYMAGHGMTVRCPLLSGHGTTPQDLTMRTAELHKRPRRGWTPSELPVGQALRKPALLFKKLDESVVKEEYARLELIIRESSRKNAEAFAVSGHQAQNTSGQTRAQEPELPLRFFLGRPLGAALVLSMLQDRFE